MKSHLLTSALVPLCALVSGCGPTYLSPPSIPAEHTITVGGTASLDLVPDEACVELTLAARAPTMAAAHAQIMTNGSALLSELRQRPGLVVEQGATSYASEYETDAGGRSHLARYVATIQVNVRTRDFAQIADTIGRASARGLDRVNVVYYATQLVARKAEVRAHALEAARDKARAMTATLGVGLGDVVTVVEGDSRTNANVSTSNYLERGGRRSGPPTPRRRPGPSRSR